MHGLGFIPPRPNGSSALVRWAQWAHEMLLSSRVQDVSGVAIARTTRGTVQVPRLTGGGTVNVASFRLVDVADDYLVCHTWDGTNEGSDEVAVAKPERLRNSITSEIKLGVEHTYTYDFPAGGSDAFNIDRYDHDTGTGLDETQRVIPVWLGPVVGESSTTPGEIITAVLCETHVVDENNDPVRWLMLADRAWTRYV